MSVWTVTPDPDAFGMHENKHCLFQWASEIVMCLPEQYIFTYV